MPYPSESNPLERHLVELRQLKSDKQRIESKLRVTLAGSTAQADLETQLTSAKLAIEAAYSAQLPVRCFDVFATPLDQRLRAFDEQNPRPSAPSRTCKHVDQELRVRTHRDGTRHACWQCVSCGRKGRDEIRPKNWGELPPFDELLRDTPSIRESAWQAARHQIRLELEGAVNEPFTFNEADFEAEYERTHPHPVCPDTCPHPSTTISRRTYKNGTWSAVRQCDICGKHRQSISKSVAPPAESMPPFDESKEGLLRAATTAWRMAHSTAWKLARTKFSEEIHRKLASGELVYTDTSLFGTYYDSAEWHRTRQRILARDEYACQSCNERATDVHHLTYARLGCENDLDLIALCRQCHNLVHYHQSIGPPGFRLLPSEVRSVLNLPLGAADMPILTVAQAAAGLVLE